MDFTQAVISAFEQPYDLLEFCPTIDRLADGSYCAFSAGADGATLATTFAFDEAKGETYLYAVVVLSFIGGFPSITL